MSTVVRDARSSSAPASAAPSQPRRNGTPTKTSAAKPVTPPVDDEVERTTLRSDDSPSAITLDVACRGADTEIQLAHAGICMLDGVWETELAVEGTRIKSTGDWTNICSEINDHAAYWELELALEKGWMIERQIFLARQDRFVFLADVVKGRAEASGEYTMRLPLPVQGSWISNPESREGDLLVGRSRTARLIPTSLPEWRNEPGGELALHERHLALRIPFRATRVHAPIFLDLDRGRLRQPVTWRRLTVGEGLQPLKPDVAAGYRVQVGKQQWLFYRSLAPVGNRSVLGQNFSTEFVAARFNPDGMTQKMLEIG